MCTTPLSASSSREQVNGLSLNNTNNDNEISSNSPSTSPPQPAPVIPTRIVTFLKQNHGRGSCDYDSYERPVSHPSTVVEFIETKDGRLTHSSNEADVML